MPTLSVIKADVGGYVGHADVHPDLMVRAAESLDKAKAYGLLVDCQVQHVGDDIALGMTHEQGEDAEPIHKLAWDTFLAVTKVAREVKMYGAGQDLLSDAFSGNIKGMGLSLIHISEPTRLRRISYAVFCLKKKKKKK